MATILAVDDDPTARELLAAVLGYRGHRVREAADGVEALTAAQADLPDLIIADLLMPTMDGFEFVRRLRENPLFAQTPVVFYTATYLESEARALAEQCGVCHIITKPAEPERILEVVSQVLGGAPTPVPPPPPVEEFRAKHLGLLLAKLSQKPEIFPRLDAMLELNLQFASERDPQQLLNNFCSSARKIVGAKYATVGLLEDDQKLRFAYASGMSPATAARVASVSLLRPSSSEAFSERQPRRLRVPEARPQAVGLPDPHPPVDSLLTAPITSPDRVYGWLCLADKVGTAEFNDEDEALAQILAAQVGRIYENGSLYTQVKQYVEELEAEVAERKRAQERFRQLNAELEERVAQRTAELTVANRELEAFSYSISHDLRAPLRHVSGFAQLLISKHSPSLPAEVQRYLNTIHRSACRMGELIDDLLNLSRVNRHQLRRDTVHLSELAREVLEELRRTSPDRQVEWVIQPGMLAEGDTNLLRIALNNLLGNAWKFTRQRPLARIEVAATNNGGGTIYFVRDNGAGFDVASAGKLFGPFQRFHSSADFEGTGIGLAIVHRIITRHGGRIWAESRIDQGATFYFNLSGRLKEEGGGTDQTKGASGRR